MTKNSKNKPRNKIRKRSLFYATDFQSLMYINFTFCKILGIFPYKGPNFEISKSRYILWTIITCAVCIYELIMFYELNFSGRIRLDIPKTITYNSHFILGALIAIFWYVLSGPRMRLLQTIQEISSRLPPESYQKLSKLIHAKDIFGFFFLLWQILMIFLNQSEMAINILFEPLRFYIAMILLQMDMMYTNCVCVLKACFKEINDKLENLRKLMTNNIPRWIYHEQRYQFLLIELKALKKQYVMVSDTVQMLNVIFSLHLLATIALCFKQIVFYLYLHVIQWQDGISFNLNEIYNGYLIFFIVHYLIRIILIVWFCETGKNQAIKIGTTIHDVLNSTNNEKIKDELHLFSLQLLHCKKTFSVKGFTIDATLITTMVNTITTYLVVLIQFLIASHSCD